MVNPSILSLRNEAPDELVSRYAPFTSDRFGAAGKMDTPHIVVIPACNEQIDLPATLFTLARSSEPILPIVVENGSSNGDKTLEYAERMGAIALHCEPAKMRATHIGLRYARHHYPDQAVIHFGDADNLYPRICISAIGRATQQVNKANYGNGALLFGLGAYDHGSSPVVDLMRTGRVLRKAVSRKASGKAPMPYGFNYAIHLGRDDQFADAINKINPLLFVREESEICNAATATGVRISQLVSLSAFVFTRGDLIRSRDEWRDFKGASMDIKTKYYKRNYPAVDFLPNSQGRDKSL